LKEVFFMRHGKTLENLEHVLTGQSDPPLSEEAREEIHSIRPYVTRPDMVFSSDLRRASETAQLLFPDHEIILLPQLRERNFNELQGQPASMLRRANLRGDASYQLDGDEGIFKDANVEPLSSLKARAEYVLNLIKEANAQKVMVVSHGVFINCLINSLLPKTRIDHPLNNLHYHKITLDDQGNVRDVKLDQEWLRH
jgi:broad specificity phosphatase PhoE